MASLNSNSTPSTNNPSSAALLLTRQFRSMQSSSSLPGISVGLSDSTTSNIFSWSLMLMLSEDQHPLYGGGIFRATLTFPPTYPHSPPTLQFQPPVPFHPNIYPNGVVCISILHAPGEDQYGYEQAGERWSPIQGPESILLSVISMLGEPNDESPANVEAGKMWREDRKGFERRVRRGVRESMENAWD